MLPTVKKYDSELYFTSHSNLNYLLVHGVYPQFRNFSLTQIHVTCNSNDTKWGLIFHGLTRIPGNTLRSGRQNGGIYQCLGDVMGNRLGSQIELINITWYCSAFLQRTGNNRDKLEGKIRFVENKQKKKNSQKFHGRTIPTMKKDSKKILSSSFEDQRFSMIHITHIPSAED